MKLLATALDPAEFHAGPNPAAWRQALQVVGAAAVVRLILGALVPVFPDEAYYWDWSRTLAFGYFDHPPMIAWLIRAGTTVFGHTPIGVRIVPILAGAGTALAVVHMARALGGDAAARLAAILFAVMPLAAVGSVLATPDMPMLCATAWTLYAVLRAVGLPASADHDQPTSPRHVLRWWLAAGAAAGLAMASKYTSVLLPASVAVAFVLHGKLQNRFGQPGPYAAVLVAAFVFAPVLGWNALNDWISFRFQLAHGLGAPRGGALGAVNRELELVGGQIALVSPILFWFVARAVRDAMRFSEEGYRLLLGTTVLVPLAFFVYSATRRSVEANWPAVAWVGAVVLLATDLPASPRARTWLRRGIVLAAALTGIVYAQVLYPILPIPAERDPIAKAFGWDLVAATVDRKRASVRVGRGAPATEVPFVAAERYQDAALLAFHLPDHPRVFAFNLIGRANQYDLWPHPRDVLPFGASVILVLDDQRDEPRAIRKLTCCFNRIDESEGVALMRDDATAQRKRVWILTGRRDGWPGRDQPFPPD